MSGSAPETVQSAGARLLFEQAYAELLRMARRERRRANSPPTINTTALVHETYFKLKSNIDATDVSRGQFFGLAARAMRQVLTDYARRVHADKRKHISFVLDDPDLGASTPTPVAMIELDGALRQLEALDAQLARIVDLHVFSGLEFGEIATFEGISERSVYRLWRNARVFLLDQLAP